MAPDRPALVPHSVLLFTEHSKDVKLHWDQRTKHSHIDPLINYHHGEINISEGQTYYVYASVHFNITEKDKVRKGYRGRQFILRLCRKVYGYEQTLLITTKLFSKSNNEVMSSLRIAGVLKLNRNDKIYVKVSKADQLIFKSTGNTFGVFPL